MPPGEENDEELVDDVEVGDVEVILERGHIDIAANLETQKTSVRSKQCTRVSVQDTETENGTSHVRSAPRIPGHA